MCPNNCSGRGECHVGNSTASVYCECEANWKGPACDVPYCLADCGFPERGRCEDKTCLCESGWQGGPLSSDCHGGNVGLARAGLHTHTHSDSKKLLAGCLYRHRELWSQSGNGNTSLTSATAPKNNHFINETSGLLLSFCPKIPTIS